MSDIMRPIPFDQLMDWVLTEKKTQGTIFGESRLAKLGGHARPIFGEKVESPVGPAAGPNTQLAQNIIAAYVTGARFFELKTVQKMDGAELSACVNKPCILAADEGYNCEWSTELTVPGAFDEYVKAWVACKLLAQEFGFGDPDGFVFNMSVGYDLEGIKGEKVDTYINNMKDASGTPVFQEAIAWAKANLDRFENVDEAFVDSISPHVSRSVTESTLHGCPPAEIERIATHLITKKGLNTYIKCNPTLLGYEYARKTLDSLGFDYIVFDEHHFNEDLQWADAVPMLKRLIALAAERGVEFGVKLTNTFPVDVTRSELPSEEMYMSGRSLYPLTVSLAKRIADEFDGSLRISFSGGADALNARSLVDAGIWPVTLATSLLKPGGYQHLVQIDEALAGIDDKPFSGVDPAKVAAIVDDALTNPRYRKPVKPTPERHVGHELPLIDCFTAPCREDCPIEQDIPGYLMACGEGRYADALRIILERNALPFTTGTICPHTCGNSCMRNYYEEHAHIREFKLLAAEKGLAEVLPTLSARGTVTGRKVAVVGAGPAGLAAASFLSRAGVDVTVFERTNELGGIVRHVIPGFRISDEAIDHDVELCSAYGATFKTGVEVTNARDLLDQGFTDVVVAVGAWAPGRPALRSGEALDAIDFLRDFKEDPAKCQCHGRRPCRQARPRRRARAPGVPPHPPLHARRRGGARHGARGRRGVHGAALPGRPCQRRADLRGHAPRRPRCLRPSRPRARWRDRYRSRHRRHHRSGRAHRAGSLPGHRLRAGREGPPRGERLPRDQRAARLRRRRRPPWPRDRGEGHRRCHDRHDGHCRHLLRRHGREERQPQLRGTPGIPWHPRGRRRLPRSHALPWLRDRLRDLLRGLPQPRERRNPRVRHA